MKRREFLTAASGAGATVAASASAAGAPASTPTGDGTATSTPGNGTGTPGNATGTAGPSTPEIGGSVKPDFGGWLDGIDGGYEDLRGKDEVTVTVGAEGNGNNYAFSPAGIWVSPGTTVQFEWTGDGGGHNVVAEEGPAGLDSDITSDAGVNYEYTFEQGGITKYVCQPHSSQGMKGAVAVGPDVETVDTGGGGGGGGGAGGGGEEELTLEDVEAMGVPFQAHWVGVATALMVFTSLVYTFFLIKYGTSPNASGGGD